MKKRILFLLAILSLACLLMSCSHAMLQGARFENSVGMNYDLLDELYGEPYYEERSPDGKMKVVIWVVWTRGTSGMTVTRMERGPLTGRKYMVTEDVGSTPGENLCLMGMFDANTNIMFKAQVCDLGKVNAHIRKIKRSQ